MKVFPFSPFYLNRLHTDLIECLFAIGKKKEVQHSLLVAKSTTAVLNKNCEAAFSTLQRLHVEKTFHGP